MKRTIVVIPALLLFFVSQAAFTAPALDADLAVFDRQFPHILAAEKCSPDVSGKQRELAWDTAVTNMLLQIESHGGRFDLDRAKELFQCLCSVPGDSYFACLGVW